MTKEMVCPYCGSGVEYAPVSRVYRNADFGGFVYLCKNYPSCDSYVRAGADGKPSGSLADRTLRQQRKVLLDLISETAEQCNVPRQEVGFLVAKVLGKRTLLVNELRDPELGDLLRDKSGLVRKIKEGFIPAQSSEIQTLKLPLRYLYIDSQRTPTHILSLDRYRGHLKMFAVAVRLGLVNRITKHGTRKVFFILTQAGKNLIGYDKQSYSTVRIY